VSGTNSKLRDVSRLQLPGASYVRITTIYNIKCSRNNCVGPPGSQRHTGSLDDLFSNVGLMPKINSGKTI